MLIISLAAYAQSGGKRFSGRVVDSETYQPVPFATVRLLALSDSSLLVGGATDAEGRFRLTVAAPKNKSLLLHVSFIGYTAVYREVSPVAGGHKNNLGDIPLACLLYTSRCV